jgi:DNA-binding NtrC family response regulator
MKKPTILLVDDEERFLVTTRKVLDKKGYEVLTAASGAGAISMLGEKTVDVVILDVKMPGMDGIATLKEIKRRHPLVEVIMLTGHGTLESAVAGLKCGATDYLTKPSDIGELLVKVEEAFEKKQGLEEKIRRAQDHRSQRERGNRHDAT